MPLSISKSDRKPRTEITALTTDLYLLHRQISSGSDVRDLQALATAVGKKWVRGLVLYTGPERHFVCE